jgi:hypothetical protein
MGLMVMRRRSRARGFSLIGVCGTLCLLVGACSSNLPQPLPTPSPRIIGPVHTEGTELIDRAGRPVRIFGIDVTGLGRGEGAPGVTSAGCPGYAAPGQIEINNIVKFGFNAVRIPITWSNLEPQAPATQPDGTVVHTYNQQYLATLDSVVTAFTSRGLAVVIEGAQSHWSPAFVDIPRPHDKPNKCQGSGMPSWLYPGFTNEQAIQARRDFFANVGNVQDGYVQMWRFLAGRYESNPLVIGADMMNEPYTKGKIAPQSLHLNELYERVGRGIRSVNEHIVLIFQDSKADPSGTYALTSPPPFQNEVYSFHLYVDDWQTEGLVLMRAYETRARSWNVPLFVGEFDAFGYASPFGGPDNWQQSLREMMAWCTTNDINWSLFTYGDRWVLEPGTDQPRPDLLPTLAAGW